MAFLEILAIFFSLLLIGFFSGIEIAFVSANRLSIELRKKQGTISGKTWGRYSEKPTRFIGTVLVGMNIFLVVYGFLIGSLLSPIWMYIEHLIKSNFPHSTPNYLYYIRLIVETILSTSIILMVEFVCKALFKSQSNRILGSTLISYLTSFFYWAFSSLAALFVFLAEWILKYVFNVKIKNKKVVFSKSDLEIFFQQNNQHAEEDNSEINKELFENALTLSDTKVRKCLIPRKEIESLSSGSTIEEVKTRLIETKLSKLVVFDNNIDNIVGYVHHLDLLKNPASLQEILHPIPTIPETMSVTDLMNKFSRERKSIAWVIDEFGGTAGIVTMEDLLEEIFGEIEDEYDTPDTHQEKQLTSDLYLFSGRLKISHLSDHYGLHFLNVENIETLSGYIIELNGSIPAANEKIIIGNFEFEIKLVNETRIETVLLKILK